MSMDSSEATRRTLQSIGVSEEEIDRYVNIEDKLRNNGSSFGEKSSQPQAATDAMNANPAKGAGVGDTESLLRSIVLEAVAPLRSTIEEIKSEVAKELAEQRLLLTDLLQAQQSDKRNQVSEGSSGGDQTPESFEVMQRQSSKQAGESTTYTQVISRSGNVSRSSDSTYFKEPFSVLGGEGESVGYKSASAVGDASTVDRTLDLPEQPQIDLAADLEWFKDQVKVLQEETRQHRQELRRREHQHQLQQNVSVSKSELQEALKTTKEEMLSSVKALCLFLEVEINSSSKFLHEESKNAVREMLLEHQSRADGEAAVEMCGKVSEANKAAGSQTTGTESEAEQPEPVSAHSITLDPKWLSQVSERLEALVVGQSQRVIDKSRNPACDREYVFYLQIPQFKSFIGTDKTVCSLPCALDFEYQFLAVRGTARFSPHGRGMSLGLERVVDVLDLGLENRKASLFTINCTIKAPDSVVEPDLVLDPVTVCWNDGCGEDQTNKFIALEKSIDCEKQIVRVGLCGFDNDSLVVEFKITLEQKQRSLLSFISK